MPVDDRTSVVLAETIGSYASLLAAGSGYAVVGVEVSASHLRAVTGGSVVCHSKLTIMVKEVKSNH